jgi:hypothetical protein
MPRRKTTPPAAIDVLIAQLREGAPTANILQEARRTLEEPAPAGERIRARDDLAAIFQQRLDEAMSAPGEKSAHLLACARLWERTRGAKVQRDEDTVQAIHERLADVIAKHHPDFVPPFFPGDKAA